MVLKGLKIICNNFPGSLLAEFSKPNVIHCVEISNCKAETIYTLILEIIEPLISTNFTNINLKAIISDGTAHVEKLGKFLVKTFLQNI